MLTDNPVLLRRQTPLPTLMCAQKKGEKKVPTEDDFIRSNIASFGNDVGAITNKGTAMYEVASGFSKSSEEYATLRYRIRGIQSIQQEAIDKAKGIVATPMPRSWYDRHAIGGDLTPHEKEVFKHIVADRKPYFMRYIYPSLSKQYTAYVRSSNKNAMRQFGLSIDEMMQMQNKDLTDQQSDFLDKFRKYMPVGMGDCTMNRICRRIEAEFDGVLRRKREEIPFDYTILKTGADYSSSHLYAVKKLMAEYDKAVKEKTVESALTRDANDERGKWMDRLDAWFCELSAVACPDKEELCEILVDLCYGKEKTKVFLWRMCKDDIVKRLLDRNGTIQFPTKDENGSIMWKSDRYSVASVEMGVEE